MMPIKHIVSMMLICFTQFASASEGGEIAEGIFVSAKTYDVPENEAPFFNFAKKTPESSAADKLFLKNFTTSDEIQAGFDGAIKRGWNYFFEGDYSTSARRFNQAHLLKPAHAAVLHGFGVLAIVRFKDPDYGEELLSLAIQHPDTPDMAYFDMGLLPMNSSRPADAIPFFRTATEKIPDYPAAWFNLSVSLMESSVDRDAACEVLRQAQVWFKDNTSKRSSADLNRAIGC